MAEIPYRYILKKYDETNTFLKSLNKQGLLFTGLCSLHIYSRVNKCCRGGGGGEEKGAILAPLLLAD
jgi:hypothetical protein